VATLFISYFFCRILRKILINAYINAAYALLISASCGHNFGENYYITKPTCQMRKCLGYKMRKIRELKNISQDYVAQHLGITQGAYSSIESGKVKINDETLLKISHALDVAVGIVINFDAEVALNACLKSTC
jgi:DNA-binding XRE family transcriptional regulator